MAELKEPRLRREIGKLAWLFTKLLAVGAVVIGLVGFLFQNHPIVGIWVLCGLACVAQIIYYGWQSYKWKKSDWDRQREQEEREQREAQERPNRGKKSSGNSNGGGGSLV